MRYRIRAASRSAIEETPTNHATRRAVYGVTNPTPARF
jgi:hypothetical protein